MTRHALWPALGVLVCSCVMVACAISFAQTEAVWVDESTQLSGLTLGFSEQLFWLAGRMDHPFTVPADRMPPVSYWLGRIWAQAFGLTEMSLRMMGIVLGLCAMPALWRAGRRVGGPVAGLFVVAFLFTSPSFILQTVEIRAYPLFFCLSSWAAYVFVRLIMDAPDQKDGQRLIVLTVLLVVMSYTHFYGIVASGVLFLTVLVHRLLSGLSVKILLICGALGTLLLAGVLPFVLRSVAMTGSGESGGEVSAVLAETLRLVFRLISSPVLLASPAALALALAGVGTLAVCVLVAVFRPSGAEGNRGLIFLLGPIVIGLVLLTVIRTQTASFAILAPHYNLWLWPLVSIALACAFALRGLWARRVVHAAAACVIAAQLVGLALLMTHKSFYSHGPAEAIAMQIETPARTLVIHDAEGLWGQSYFPLSYLTRGALEQWLVFADGHVQRITKPGLVDIADPETEKQGFERIIHVRTAELDSRQLAALVRNAATCQPAPAPRGVVAAPQEIRSFCAYFAASYSVTTP